MTEIFETNLFHGEEEACAADSIVRRYVRETPVEPSPALSTDGNSVWLKLENQQVTGSFKVRGALNKVLRLSDEERGRGVVACSAGNHGLGVAFASQVSGCPCTVFVPESIDSQRRRELDRFAVDLRVVPGTYCDAERAALEFAKQQSLPFISPYNDPLVIAGQATVGIELARQLPELDVVIVAVGGGGLVAGVGAYLKAIKPHVRVVGVSPVNSAFMFDAVHDTPPEFSADIETLSDSTAGAIQEGSMTIPLCKAVIDQWVLVEESDIRAAMGYLFYEHRLVVEGAGALAVAAFLKEQARFEDANVALLVCGGNIDPKKFLTILNRRAVTRER
jgi:threonine dehydratase